MQGAVTSASSLANIDGLVAGGGLYPSLGGDLFFAAAGLFAVVMVLTPIVVSACPRAVSPETSRLGYGNTLR